MVKKRLFFLLVGTAVILLLFLLMQPLSILRYREQLAFLFPKGMIALEERNLLFLIQLLMLLVILPVYILTFIFSWRYRAGKRKAPYDPTLSDNKFAEVIWWGLPLVMTLIIGGITWVKTYELDPYKPITSHKPPLKIQVVALQWKWLFIYPEEKIATVNFFQFPVSTPLHFEITADAPMNSFWIPQLGGQIYAMPGMQTELHLIADKKGLFRGSSANFSGEGFSKMHFIAKASTEEEFQNWVKEAKNAPLLLAENEYQQLASPSTLGTKSLYRLDDGSLFHHILMKPMIQIINDDPR